MTTTQLASRSTVRPTTRLVALAAACLVAVPTLASCGNNDSSSGPASATQASGSGQGGQTGRGQGGQGRMPGVSGQIAAVQGSTLQVQGNNQQTAVTVGSNTTMLQSKPGTLADIKAGSCVMVRTGGNGGGNGASGSSSQTSAPTGDGATLQAASVEVSQPTAQGCAGAAGRQGGPGGGNGGNGGTRTGRPTDAPTGSGQGTGGWQGGNGGRGMGRGGLSGQVTAVSATGFSVQPTVRGQGGTGSAAPTTAGVQQVTVDASTAITTLVAATQADLTAGKCVTALGQTDSSGTVAASSITVRNEVGGSCNGGRPGGGRGTGAPTGGSTGTSSQGN